MQSRLIYLFWVLFFFSLCTCEGAPVAVGMTIDVASIDMVSEVNMVSARSVSFYFLRTCYIQFHNSRHLLEKDFLFL